MGHHPDALLQHASNIENRLRAMAKWGRVQPPERWIGNNGRLPGQSQLPPKGLVPGLRFRQINAIDRGEPRAAFSRAPLVVAW
ncbi:MAG: hypothetical protein ABFD89_29740 [Bryobacteraceae bacterium]